MGRTEDECAFAMICMSRPGTGANEESSTLQEARSSKPGEERGEKCKGGEDVRGGGDGEERRASVRKLSLTRRQSRDLLKKKISVEEQVPLVLTQVQLVHGQVPLVLGQMVQHQCRKFSLAE